MRLYTRWLNLSQNLLLDVTNLRLFFCDITRKMAQIIVYFLSFKRMQLFIQNIELMDEAFECLGIKKNYYKIFKRILCEALLYFILIVYVYIGSFYSRGKRNSNMNLIKTIMCTNIIQWPIYTSTVVDFSFATALTYVLENFLKSINLD